MFFVILKTAIIKLAYGKIQVKSIAMKIDEMSREELKELMKEVLEEVLAERAVDNDGQIKPEIEQQLLEIRARRQYDDQTISADEVKRRLGMI
jgi:ribosomal protein L29